MIHFKEDFPEAIAFIDQFLDPTDEKPKYIFGTNEDAVSLASKVKIDGFVEDIKPLTELNSIPVIKSDQIKSGALIIIVALMSPITISKKLDHLNVEYLHYIAFLNYANLDLQPPWFWNGFKEDYFSHKNFYRQFDQKLEDQISKDTYQQLMNFRLTGNIKYHQGFSDQQKNQYFEDFLALKEGEIFVDVGSFDGQTSLEFIRKCPDYKAIHIFEPEHQNMQTVKKALAKFDKIIYHSYGLSDSAQTLGILSNGSTSKVVKAGTGDYDIKVDQLDRLLDAPVTFIKMDIEGNEQKAIDGARNIITTHKPKLAIGVYHHGNDYRVIYEKIISMNPNYKIYLRHYTEGIVETVMFFI